MSGFTEYEACDALGLAELVRTAKVILVADIPRTISGKIVELAVREAIHGRPVRNQDALANPEALALYTDLPELAT